uniref:Uncharacterized protein LOC113789620 n=1 Tax=Dermatophagoides pteronyssinus TaxID=6956 RepID=A0A6P6XND9_DERPT|nr:uncharacterized protein LOC113789620 [Dermatophagoides pteronyssinus]
MSSRSGRKRGTNRAIVDFDSVNDQPQTNNATGSNVNDESNNDFIAGTNVTETEVLISNCIRYILLNENLKLLIKQADINKHLGECFNLDRSKMNHLMRMVTKRLWKDFGMLLIEVEITPRSYLLYTIYEDDLLTITEKNNSDDDDDISFDETLVPENIDDEEEANDDDLDFDDLTYEEVLDNSKRILMIIILSFILLEDEEKITENELFNGLKEIGLCIDHKYEIARDCCFKQNIKELITKEFVRKSYLKRTKISQTDTNLSPDYLYEWGIRSRFEFKRNDILDFIKNIYDGDEIHMNLLYGKIDNMEKQRELLIENTIRYCDDGQQSIANNNNQISNDVEMVEIVENVVNNNNSSRRSQRHEQIENQITQLSASTTTSNRNEQNKTKRPIRMNIS